MKKLFLLFITLSLIGCASTRNKGKIKFEGYFSYMADAAMFIDCETNERYSVANQADYLTIEQEYLRIVENAGEKILISFTGKVEDKKDPKEEGNRKKIIITKLLNILPDSECE